MSKPIYFTQAIADALREELARDERVFVMGEDIHVGVLGRTAGLIDEFGPERIRNTPISEAAFLGAGVGAAATGMRPVVDLMVADFLFVCMDQVSNQAGKLRYMMGGSATFPLTIFATMMGTNAAQHSDAPYAQVINGGGIKVVVPSTPKDAKGLVKSAIRDPNPVLVLFHAMLGSVRGEVPEGEHLTPIGKARVLREGTDATVVAIGLMARRAIEAADQLEASGISIEVVDPRTIYPLDYETIFDSLGKTGRLVVVDEARRSCSVASEITARVATDALHLLQAPPRILANPDVHIPHSRKLVDLIVPQTDGIVEAVQEVMSGSLATVQ